MSVLAVLDPAVDVLHDVLLSTSHALPGPVPFQLAAGVALLTGALIAVAWLSSRQQPAGPARAFPYVTVVIATLAPAAVSVYLLSTTAWTVAERALLPHLLG